MRSRRETFGYESCHSSDGFLLACFQPQPGCDHGCLGRPKHLDRTGLLRREMEQDECDRGALGAAPLDPNVGACVPGYFCVTFT
jgi:hypothetical protein